MADYTHNNPVRNDTTDGDGTRTATVSKLGATQFIARDDRMPAFVGLAKATGGVYVENENGMTLDEALRAAKMDFRVEIQEPIQVTEVVPGGVTITADGVTTTPDKTITTTYPFRGTRAFWPGDPQPVGLGMVKSRYQLVSPTEAAELGNQVMMSAEGSNVVAAGIYGNPKGARTYLAFKLPEGLTIGGEDRHDLYLTILNSFDGETGLSGLFAPIRLACTNMTTATFGRKVANRFSFKHTGDISDKLEQAREALGIAAEWSARWKQEAERLLTMPLAGDDLNQFLRKVMPTPKTVKTDNGARNWDRRRFEMKQIITESDTCAFGRGTAYAALQGVQEWADWLSETKESGLSGAISRFTRMIDGGDTEKTKLRAAALLGV